MEYKHIKTVKDNDGLCILIEADGVQLWVDCWKYRGDWEVGFNAFMFNLYNSKDLELKATQEKILEEDFENFDYFIDEILAGLEE